MCSVHRGMFSTLKGIQYIGDIMTTSGDIMMDVGDIMMHVGDTESASGDVQYTGGLYCSVHRGDIMMHVGEQVDKSFQFLLKTPMY